jgi:prepilin-type N-terminal cleavage/methylation domain-containing protein/prepilin-type processing-associated H-X9-DG protein
MCKGGTYLMKTDKGFTLIELLVVIAIIAVLAAILFPVFAQARDKARQSACLSHAKQVGLAARMYNTDYDEMWVPYAYGVCGPGIQASEQVQWGDCALIYWVHNLEPYIKNRQIYVCPSRDYTYLWYGLMDGEPTGDPTCSKCRLISWTWNAIGTNGQDDSAWCPNHGWPFAQQVDPSFTVTGKTGFTILPSSYWTASPVPDAVVEDPAGTIWLDEGIWPDINCDWSTDYGWLINTNKRKVGRYHGYHVRDRHSEGFNAVYGDGHAKWNRWGNTRPSMWTIQRD